MKSVYSCSVYAMHVYLLQISLNVDGHEQMKHLSYDVNLIHPDNYVFLGGSDDTMLLTQSFVHDNFHGTIRKVCPSFIRQSSICGMTSEKAPFMYLFNCYLFNCYLLVWLGDVMVIVLCLRLEIAGSIPAAALSSATLDKLFTRTHARTHARTHTHAPVFA